MRALAIAGLAALAGSACSDPCCTFDSRVIPLTRAAAGALLVKVADGDGGQARTAVFDTGTPITLWDDGVGGPAIVSRRNLRFLGAGDDDAPTRAVLRGATTVSATLGAVGTSEAPVRPRALIGGDLLAAFSVQIGFRAPEIALWTSQPATDGFLASAGYAVLRIARRGGGELEVTAPSGGIGPDGPYQYPASLLVLRACAAPAQFSAEAELPARCCLGDERRLATGADLSLVIGTGAGPLVLGRSAWERVRGMVAAPAAPRRAPLFVATSREPIDAEWTTMPRLALVDREADPNEDPGPCVELGRSRRLEQVALRQSRAAESAACVLPCDRDTAAEGTKAHNTASYLELGGEIPVAVIDDREPYLQTLRQEIRPEGPEVAGVLGAGVLQDARVELDYRGQPSRAVFSCETDAPAERCRAVGRCPRLPGPGPRRACFGLPPHGLPRMCDNQQDSCR